MPPAVAAAVAAVPGVEAISSVRGGQAQAFGETIFVTAVDTQAPAVLTFDWKNGSQAVLGELGADGAVVDDAYAEEHNLQLGSPFPLETATARR